MADVVNNQQSGTLRNFARSGSLIDQMKGGGQLYVKKII